MLNSIEQTQKADHLTDRYKFISTMDVIEKAKSFGWSVVSSKEARTSKYQGYQKHIVIMEKPDFKIHIDGKESWSWADIEPNWKYEDKPGNPWNEVAREVLDGN